MIATVAIFQFRGAAAYDAGVLRHAQTHRGKTAAYAFLLITGVIALFRCTGCSRMRPRRSWAHLSLTPIHLPASKLDNFALLLGNTLHYPRWI